MSTTALPAELGARDGGPFVGRAPERAALLAAWRRADAGDRQLVLIAGEPGIGKTRLVGQLATALHRDGAVVLHGRCDPDVVFPYQPLAEAFRQLLQRGDDALDEFAAARPALGLLVPELATQDSIGTADGAAERAALFAASAATLVFVAQRGALHLAIDDAHWASRPTLHLVRHVLRATIGTPMLVTITYRDTELARSPLSELVADLHNETGVERVLLGGLDEPAVAELIAAAGATANEGLVADLIRDTGGNPFFLGEMLRHLRESGADGRAPERVRDVLAVRVGRLPASTREHLTAAAVVGPRFDLDLLTAIGVPGDPLDAIEPAVDARLVRELNDPVGRFAFAHALIRQALLDDLGPTRAARLHEQVARAIEQRGDRDERAAEIAGHYLAAVRLESVHRGARWALRAAESVTWRSAPEASLELTSTALAALAHVPDHELELEVNLLIEKAMALLVLQRNSEFLVVAGDAVATARRSGSAHDFALAVATRGCYTPTGTNDRTFITDIEEALGVVGDDELAVRSRLHSGMSVALLVTNADRHDALAHAQQAAALADRSGVFFDRWMSRFVGTLAAFCDPDTTTLNRLGEELQSLGTEYGDENASCHGLRACASARLIHGDLDGYTQILAECERRWGAIHNAWGTGACAAARFIEACARGRYDEAEAAVGELLPLSANDPNFAAIYAGQVILLRIFQERRVELDAFIGASAASFPQILELQIQHGSCRFEQRDVAGARQICRDVLARPELMRHDFGELSRLGSAIELAVAVDELEVLPMLIEAILPYEGQLLVVNLGIGMVGPVDRFLAAAAGALGDVDRADQWFASALAWEEANGCTPMATVTRRWWSQARDRRTRNTSGL